MKNNKKLMALNIQLFAEEVVTEEPKEEVSVPEEAPKVEEEKTQKEEKLYTRAEVNKMINAERKKVADEKSEAEKLEKMDTEQKLKYQLEQTEKTLAEYQGKVNALELRDKAKTLADEKGLPIGYIEDLDFAHETAESIKEKIEKLVGLRSKDLESYLNDKLKQPSPKAVESAKKETEDPYLKGYKNYKK